MKLFLYGTITTVLSSVVLHNIFTKFPNFYTACIYLSKSNASLLVLFNSAIFISIIFGQFLQAVFFGPLRAIEIEHLYERSWFAVTETCLAMTIFRDDFDTQFVVLFGGLLFVKIFHWLLEDRVDFMEQSTTIVNNIWFHVRMLGLMMFLLFIDISFVLYSISSFYDRTSSHIYIVFGFEYAVLCCAWMTSFFKYGCNYIESRHGEDEQWENKSILIFYMELFIDFLKLIIYLIFFSLIVKIYGFPLHIIRDLYLTTRSFLQKFRDLLRFRQATRNMNERYPDATMEELSHLNDPTCIICREDMVHRDSPDRPTVVPAIGRENQNSVQDIPKKLPCGHIFHFGCLRSWLERQQSCPTCRNPVLQNLDDGPPQTNPPQPNPQRAPENQDSPFNVNRNSPPFRTQSPTNQSVSANTSRTNSFDNQRPGTSRGASGSTTQSNLPSFLQNAIPLGNAQTVFGSNPPSGIIPADQIANLLPSNSSLPSTSTTRTNTRGLSRDQIDEINSDIKNKIEFLTGVQNQIQDIVTSLSQVNSAAPSLTTSRNPSISQTPVATVNVLSPTVRNIPAPRSPAIIENEGLDSIDANRPQSSSNNVDNDTSDDDF